jgi:hypothetical protein
MHPSTHGEDRARSAMAKLIHERYKLSPALPRQGETVEI